MRILLDSMIALLESQIEFTFVIMGYRDFAGNNRGNRIEGLRAQLPVTLPFPALAMLDDPAPHRAAAESWIREESPPNPALGAAIAKLSGRKFILPNGTRHHADAVMRRLEIEQHFDGIFDIKAAELEPKPRPQVYERFLARHDVDPAKAAIFEDLARNLEVPHALGMTTVVVVPEGARVVLREEWELAGRDAPHVDHVTDDLAGFLRGIVAA